MGQESSHEAFDPAISPQHLTSRTLPAIASYITSGRCKKIDFLVGAGISTAAGIPDFRSPTTGLYSSLARLDLPRPEAVFDISFFRSNPQPFYTLAQELYPGRYAPTLTHVFMRVVHERGLLGRVFTQNIDTLELAAGLPRERVVFAHGSFAGQRCADCRVPYTDSEKFLAHVRRAEPVRCGACGEGWVKPDITFFGEALPAEFHEGLRRLEEDDELGLAVVMGSSLSVYPFAALPQRVKGGVPRLLVNMEKVGDVGSRRDDVVWIGECDQGMRKLAEALGWWEEVESLWQSLQKTEVGAANSLEEELEKLTGDVERSLKVAEEHRRWVEDGLKEPVATSPAASAELTTPVTPIERQKNGYHTRRDDSPDTLSRQISAEIDEGTPGSPREEGNLAHVFLHLKPKV